MTTKQESAQILRRAADRLDDAFTAFLDGERDGDAWVSARDYREAGYELAEEAWLLPDDDRDDFVEAGAEFYTDSARYLVASACAFRLAELASRAPEMAVAA